VNGFHGFVDASAKAFDDRLMAETDSENRDGFVIGGDDFFAVAGFLGCSGAWGNYNELGFFFLDVFVNDLHVDVVSEDGDFAALLAEFIYDVIGK